MATITIKSTTSASIDTPASGRFSLFVDSSNSNKLSTKDSSGTVAPVVSGGGGGLAGTMTDNIYTDGNNFTVNPSTTIFFGSGGVELDVDGTNSGSGGIRLKGDGGNYAFSLDGYTGGIHYGDSSSGGKIGLYQGEMYVYGPDGNGINMGAGWRMTTDSGEIIRSGDGYIYLSDDTYKFQVMNEYLYFNNNTDNGYIYDNGTYLYVG